MASRRSLRVRARGFMWALCAALIFVLGGATVARAAQTVSPANVVQVWNVNTALMHIDTAAPGTDYRKFVTYITDSAHAEYFPDIVTIQEAGSFTYGSRASCTEFAAKLHNATGRSYDCRETGHQGGAAVVFRNDMADGFSVTQQLPVQEKLRTSDSGSCSTTGSDWYAQTVQLKDVSNLKRVNVASFHFPTIKNGPALADCAPENMDLLEPTLAANSPDMRISAGDANRSDATASSNNNTYGAWQPWYRHVNLKLATTTCPPDLCWKDAMYQKWYWALLNASQNPTDSGMYSYLHAYEWSYMVSGTYAAPTVTDRRDYLFFKSYGVALEAAHQPWTVPWPDAGGTTVPYSDHRGQGALLQYAAPTP